MTVSTRAKKTGWLWQLPRYSLLSVIGKIYAMILEQRIRGVVERQLSEAQYGFRPQRSTTDAIFVLKQVIEKAREFSRAMYILFIDVEKA